MATSAQIRAFEQLYRDVLTGVVPIEAAPEKLREIVLLREKEVAAATAVPPSGIPTPRP